MFLSLKVDVSGLLDVFQKVNRKRENYSIDWTTNKEEFPDLEVEMLALIFRHYAFSKEDVH